MPQVANAHPSLQQTPREPEESPLTSGPPIPVTEAGSEGALDGGYIALPGRERPAVGPQCATDLVSRGDASGDSRPSGRQDEALPHLGRGDQGAALLPDRPGERELRRERGHRVPPLPVEGGEREDPPALGQWHHPPAEGREGVPVGGSEEAHDPTVPGRRAGAEPRRDDLVSAEGPAPHKLLPQDGRRDPRRGRKGTPMAPEASRLRGLVHTTRGDPAETVKRRDLIERCYDLTAKGNKGQRDDPSTEGCEGIPLEDKETAGDSTVPVVWARIEPGRDGVERTEVSVAGELVSADPGGDSGGNGTGDAVAPGTPGCGSRLHPERGNSPPERLRGPREEP